MNTAVMSVNSDLIDKADSLTDSTLYGREYFLREDVCRFCWTKAAGSDCEANSQMINCTLKSPLFFKVLNCLNIDLSQDYTEYYPKKVCQDCLHKIEEYNDFKILCLNRNEKLHQILNKNNRISVNINPVHPKAVKFEKIEEIPIEDYSNLNVASSERIIDCPPNTPPSLEEIIQSSETKNNNKKVLESIPSIKTNAKKCEKDKNQYSSRNTKPKFLKRTKSSKKTCIKSKILIETPQQLKSTINKDIEPTNTTNNYRKQSYKAKKTSTYCNICCDNFVDQDTFVQHNIEAHGIQKDGFFKCFGCEKIHPSRKARLNHEAYFCKGLENGYKCSICDRFLPRRGVYEKHMRDHRYNKVIDVPEDNIFKCTKCCKQFTKKGDWKVHMEEHIPKKNYVCETCGRIFTRHDYLKKHNVTHTGDRRYECTHCGFRTTQKTNLTIHIRKHTDERPYSCDLCPQRCVSSSNLRAHRRRHLGINSFQCSICNKKFGYKISLKEHIAITHERSQMHPCPHCASVYARGRGLRRHLLTKHAAELGKNEKESPNTLPSTSGILYPNASEDGLRRHLLTKHAAELSKNEKESPNTLPNTSGILYPNASEDKTVQGVLYPLNKNSEEITNQNSANIAISNLNSELEDGSQQFDLKIGANDKFVCFEKNLDFGLKGGEKIVIVLQE